MPQRMIDGRYEMDVNANMAKAFRLCKDQGMTSEQARRYVTENHPATQTFLLNAVIITTFPAMQEEFRTYLDNLGSFETLAREARKKGTGNSGGKRSASPSFLNPPWYPEYLKTHHWQVSICPGAIAHYKSCAACGSITELVVHHRNYNKLGRETLDDLSVFCADCHRKITQKVVPSLRAPKTPPPEVKRLLEK